LFDTLRDRRTLIAMVLVPMVLYPALMLGSIQAFELQTTRLAEEKYRVVVANERVARWLRRLLDTDAARRPGAEGKSAEELLEAQTQPVEPGAATRPVLPRGAERESGAVETARMNVYERPPEYEVIVLAEGAGGPAQPFRSARELVLSGQAHVALFIEGPIPALDGRHAGMPRIALLFDQSDPRSGLATSGIEGVLERARLAMVRRRLADAGLDASFDRPIEVALQNVAPQERVSGAIIGQIVPLILIIMTITGAIYPAIDLTAGERERGTLETLMVAPVPTVDLIAGKFVVVALIGMISAMLNLASIGGTIWLGGLGNILTRGHEVSIPLHVLPLVLLVLIPLAVMFSAMLLAVCSFARSFKEAQNYVMPVMIAALIPAVVGILPGTRLEGPLLIMPVANIVILTRDLFTGKLDLAAILWVTLSTTIYAGAAVAVAAKLFGQEAVLFADSASVKTIFQRRFFKPAATPSVAQALLLLAIVFSLNYFIATALMRAPGVGDTENFWYAGAAVLVILFLALPMAACRYMRVAIPSTFSLAPPPPVALAAGFCLGLSTWILAKAWFAYQRQWLPMLPEMEQEFARLSAMLDGVNPFVVLVLLAVVPALCEEFFFRGYVLSGVRGALGPAAAVLVVAFAFGISHHSVQRIVPTTALGLMFGLLVVRSGSIWPAILAHSMHNGISALAHRADGLKSLLERLGFAVGPDDWPATPWILGAAAVAAFGLLLSLLTSGMARSGDRAQSVSSPEAPARDRLAVAPHPQSPERS
jgi:ABC-type Na+ efflux pump permease subunit